MDVRSQLQPWCLNPAQSEVSARPHCGDVSPVGRQTKMSKNHRNQSNSLFIPISKFHCSVPGMWAGSKQRFRVKSKHEDPAVALTPNLGDFGQIPCSLWVPIPSPPTSTAHFLGQDPPLCTTLHNRAPFSCPHLCCHSPFQKCDFNMTLMLLNCLAPALLLLPAALHLLHSAAWLFAQLCCQ